MNKRPGHVVVTTEVAVCTFCGRPRTLRRESHQLGGLVRTIVTCEACHRTLSSTISAAAAQPEAEPAAEAAQPTAETVPEGAPEPAAADTLTAKTVATAAPKRKPAAAKAPAWKSKASRKK